jgi:hypothetical protein
MIKNIPALTATIKRHGETQITRGGYETKRPKISLSVAQMFESGYSVSQILENATSMECIIKAARELKDRTENVMPMHDVIDFIIDDSVTTRMNFSPQIANKEKFISKLSELRSAGIESLSILERYYDDERKQIITADILYSSGFTNPNSFMDLFDLRELRKAGYEITVFAPKPKMKPLAIAGYPYIDIKKIYPNTKLSSYIKQIIYATIPHEHAQWIQYFKIQGINAKTLNDAESTFISLEKLRAAGFTAKDFKDSGIANEKILGLGWPLQDLKDAGFSKDELELVEIKVMKMNGEGSLHYAPKHIKVEQIKKFIASGWDLYIHGVEEPLEDDVIIAAASTQSKCNFFSLPCKGTPKQYGHQKLLYTEEEINTLYPEQHTVNHTPGPNN